MTCLPKIKGRVLAYLLEWEHIAYFLWKALLCKYIWVLISERPNMSRDWTHNQQQTFPGTLKAFLMPFLCSACLLWRVPVSIQPVVEERCSSWPPFPRIPFSAPALEMRSPCRSSAVARPGADSFLVVRNSSGCRSKLHNSVSSLTVSLKTLLNFN